MSNRVYVKSPSKTKFLNKVLYKVIALESSLMKEPSFKFGNLYVPKIHNFYFPRFISNVSIFIEDVNWKDSIFLSGMFW